MHNCPVTQRTGVAVQLAGRGAAAALVLVETGQPVEQVLQGADLGRARARGSSAGGGMSPTLAQALPCGSAAGSCAHTQVVNPDSEARWESMVAGARPRPPAAGGFGEVVAPGDDLAAHDGGQPVMAVGGVEVVAEPGQV